MVIGGLQIYKILHKDETQLNTFICDSFRLQMLQNVAKSMTKTTGQSPGGFQPSGLFASVSRAIKDYIDTHRHSYDYQCCLLKTCTVTICYLRGYQLNTVQSKYFLLLSL